MIDEGGVMINIKEMQKLIDLQLKEQADNLVKCYKDNKKFSYKLLKQIAKYQGLITFINWQEVELLKEP